MKNLNNDSGMRFATYSKDFLDTLCELLESNEAGLELIFDSKKRPVLAIVFGEKRYENIGDRVESVVSST